VSESTVYVKLMVKYLKYLYMLKIFSFRE